MRVNVANFGRRLGPLFSRWDVLAVLLILGLLVFLGEASRHLLAAACRIAAAAAVARSAPICPNTPRARRCACWSRWCCR